MEMAGARGEDLSPPGRRIRAGMDGAPEVRVEPEMALIPQASLLIRVQVFADADYPERNQVDDLVPVFLQQDGVSAHV